MTLDTSIDLAADALGGFVVYATDDYFAEKENLLSKEPPIFVADKYTDKGKWMDGWESQRRRSAGHDFAVIRLGAPGRIRRIVVDTTHFKGNAPSACRLDVACGSPNPLNDSDWHTVLQEQPLKADSENAFTVAHDGRATHVRLHIFPDGGVSRLRVFGDVLADERAFLDPAAIDLGAVQNGAVVTGASNAFFGPPYNLLLPGGGANMSDGWETARRRTPGSEWVVIELARPGFIERIELDTHFFKGNAPQAMSAEAIDASDLSSAALAAVEAGQGDFIRLLGRSATLPHRTHTFAPDRRMRATHVRVHIYPHGGVHRLRLYGHAADIGEARLGAFNALAKDQAEALARVWNASTPFAQALCAARPFASVRDLLLAADRAWWALDASAWLEAFAAHPRLGDKGEGAGAFAKASATEQAALVQSAELSRLNQTYAEKFGFVFILCASGKTQDEVLAALNERLLNSRDVELQNAACEQAQITRLRIERWLLEKA
jgi:allantoicase